MPPPSTRGSSAWDDATFLAHLPELRLAFAGLTPRETDRVADAGRPAARWRPAVDPSVRRDVDEETVATAARQVSVGVADLLRARRAARSGSA